MTKNPNWWTSTHDSAWDRIKAAFQRDWEQTKADFGGRAKDINQNAADTFAQAAGSAPIPPPVVPNAPSANDVERHENSAEAAERKAFDATRKLVEAPPDADRIRNLEQKAAVARGEAVEARRDVYENQNLRWANVEEAVRFGYGAGMYRTDPWNDASGNLKTEWTDLHPDQSWADVKEHVEAGWNKARAQDLVQK